MRGWVAISVTATPAAAPRRIREVLRIVIRRYPLHPTEQDAAEFVRRQVAVIVTNGLATPAAKAATATIPIVFTTGFDPVRTGFVVSLSRPGGNVTGVVHTVGDLAAKQLGLLHELAPKDAVIAVLGDSNQPEQRTSLQRPELGPVCD